MKIKRPIALLIVALLVVGAIGFIGYRVFAQANKSTTTDVQPCDQYEDGEVEGASEADDIEEPCGDVNDNESDDAGEAAQANELSPDQALVSSEQAQSIAEQAYPGAAALAVEYEREGSKGIWEVELNNGMEVEVDASSGDILSTEGSD